MPLTYSVLRALPATLPELCAMFRRSSRTINATLCNLRADGLVRRSAHAGKRHNTTGPMPKLWVRT